MKKTFQLEQKNKKRERVVEAIKNEVRKYIKRERSKELPEGCKVWQFDCAFALEGENPKSIEFNDIIANIDKAAQSDASSFYLQIIAKAMNCNEKD